MRILGVTVIFVLFLLGVGTASADTIYVPENYSSHFGFVGNLYMVGISGDPLDYEGRDWDCWFAPHVELGLLFDRPHAGPFVWDLIEPAKGEYNFSKPDRYVREAQERGIMVLATIWPFADWDQDWWRNQEGWEKSSGFEQELPDSRYKPHNTEAYREYIQTLVERYDGDGVNDMPGLLYPVKHWEVLNEPSSGLVSEMNFFRGSDQDYLEVLQITYEAVKEADPEAVILHGGAIIGGIHTDFWDGVYESGGTDYFDLANVHHYPSISNQNEDWNEFYTLLSNYGQNNAYWITEFATGKNVSSETEHAELLIKNYVTSFASGANKIFYTHYTVPEGNPALYPEEALLAEYGEKKPAYYALQTLVKKIDFFTGVETISTGKYKFMVDGSSVYVLWGSGSVPPEITGNIIVTNMTGNEEEKDASEIELSDTPIFVQQIEANVSVVSFAVEPATISTGESFIINATVTNTGDVAGNMTLDFKKENSTGAMEVFDTKTVSVDAGTMYVESGSTSYAVAGDYNVTVNDLDTKTVTVEAAGAVYAKDLDGDGLYEDADNSGSFNFGDVIFFFQNFDSETVAKNAKYFDFENDGSINFGDVIGLFKML